MGFDRVGIFTYSVMKKIHSAHNLIDNIPAEEKEAGHRKLWKCSRKSAYEKNQEKIGKTFKVIIDKKEAGKYLGRTEFDSVEVDNEVIINRRSFTHRRFCKCKNHQGI